ncbi:MAG: HdeD family acid-resistance protein [Rhizobiaceae bacterium]
MKNWVLLLIVGILFVIAGIAALLNPFAASLAVNFIAGWSFIVVGILQMIEAISAEGWGGKLWSLLLGVVSLLVGISLVANPLEGVVSLTIVLGVMFLISGIFKLIVGFRVHDNVLKWTVVLSGVISAILGVMILTNLPGAAVIALGVMLAIELLSNGVSAISLALSRKSGGVANA